MIKVINIEIYKRILGKFSIICHKFRKTPIAYMFDDDFYLGGKQSRES